MRFDNRRNELKKKLQKIQKQTTQVKSEAERILERCKLRDMVEFGRSTVIVDESDSF